MITTPSLDVTAVKAALLSRSEAVCRYLLPGGQRVGREWKCGDLDGNPGESLSVNLATGVWMEFAGNAKGSNLVELWKQARGIDFPQALREAAAFCAQSTAEPRRLQEKPTPRPPWPHFRVGTTEELRAVAELRGIAVEGITLASDRGLLRFADWRGHRCWIVTDSRRINAQARRMDGMPFVVAGKSRKADTLAGSRASVPLGLVEARNYSAIALVEGGPDLLAAHGCIWGEGCTDVAVVAMLGAGHRPSDTMWAALAGKRVKVFPHNDESGLVAGTVWGRAVARAGAPKVERFCFNGLRKVDGSPVNDLNDLLALHPDDFEADRDTWEVLP